MPAPLDMLTPPLEVVFLLALSWQEPLALPTLLVASAYRYVLPTILPFQSVEYAPLTAQHPISHILRPDSVCSNAITLSQTSQEAPTCALQPARQPVIPMLTTRPTSVCRFAPARLTTMAATMFVYLSVRPDSSLTPALDCAFLHARLCYLA